MELLWWVILIIGGLLLGGIMFCQWIPAKLVRVDVYRESDNHNPGASNAFRLCGWKIGLLCVTLDILKGFIPVLLAVLLLNPNSVGLSLVILAPALGHALGIFNGFHGGKCIATSFGILAALIPVTWVPFAVLAGLFLFFTLVWKIDPGSLRSVIVYALFVLICIIVLPILNCWEVAFGCLLMGLFPILRFTVWKEKEKYDVLI